MRGIVTSTVFMACLGLAGCSGGDDGSGETGASGSMSTTATETTDTAATGTGTSTGTGAETGTSTGGPEATKGLPEGVSTWTGQGVINSLTFGFDVTITNSGGDLTATATMKDDPGLGLGSPEFALSGTHEPTAGRVALAPNTWITPPDVNIELIGLEGVYDPAAKTLTGTLVDFAKGTENFLLGGPFTLTLVDGAGAATTRGDESKSLAIGSQKFSGQLQCSGPVRETEGELVYDGAGGLTGTLTVGDPGLATPIGAFTITGVHNPSTGGITLVPGLWIDDQGAVLAFYIDGTYDPGTGSFNGDQWTNTAACPTGTWKTTIQ